MAVDALHPSLAKVMNLWERMRDTHEGMDAVKRKRDLYLSPTSGMVQDGLNSNQAGLAAYEAYLKRAYFPDLVSDGVRSMLGVMHHKPPTIELPRQLEPLRNDATLEHESLEMLLRRINEEQLVTGRLGLLADMPQDRGDGIPYIAFYAAETITNWDLGRRDGIAVENLNLVILKESEYERKENFQWEFVEKYRVLVLGDVLANEKQGDGTYQVTTTRKGEDFNPANLITPMFRGRPLDAIPFCFINSRDIVAEPEQPPLLGLADLTLAIYRGEADYRQALFMQGQDTLVVVGSVDAEATYRTGANAAISLPAGGDAKYIGVDSSGLEEQRAALENDYARAASRGGQIMDSVSRERESGEALTTRVGARTATLNQVALSGAFGLERILKNIATWVGADPELVKVIPSLDFTSGTLKPDDLVKLMAAKGQGAPISNETIHGMIKVKGMTDKDFESELKAIEEEMPLPLHDGEEEEEEDPGQDVKPATGLNNV